MFDCPDHSPPTNSVNAFFKGIALRADVGIRATILRLPALTFRFQRADVGIRAAILRLPALTFRFQFPVRRKNAPGGEPEAFGNCFYLLAMAA